MQRTYPHGVTCWIDLEVPDVDAARAFYGELFGWSFEDAVPPGAPGSYLIATLDGKDVAALAPTDDDADDDAGDAAAPPAWATSVAVDDADATAAAVTAAGGTVLAPPADAGPGGRTATCRDPGGATFRLWQARRRLGAQLTNAPGTWNFSDLHTPDVAAALAFYRPLFGWEADVAEVADAADAADAVGGPSMLRVPGYGDHLAATVDPGIRERQAAAPPGFADVIGAIAPVAEGEAAHWHVTFAVADRERTLAAAERLGATVLSTSASPWTRAAVVRDPQGAEFTVSQFTPPA